MRQENNARVARVEAEIEGNTNAVEAMQTRIDALENSKISSSSGFTESSTEEEGREFRQEVVKKHAMEESLEDRRCPAKPITHAFLQNRKGSKRISLPIQTRLEPRGKILTKTTGVCDILPHHNLRNTVEQNQHRRRTTTNLSTMYDRGHNQT